MLVSGRGTPKWIMITKPRESLIREYQTPKSYQISRIPNQDCKEHSLSKYLVGVALIDFCSRGSISPLGRNSDWILSGELVGDLPKVYLGILWTIWDWDFFENSTSGRKFPTKEFYPTWRIKCYCNLESPIIPKRELNWDAFLFSPCRTKSSFPILYL